MIYNNYNILYIKINIFIILHYYIFLSERSCNMDFLVVTRRHWHCEEMRLKYWWT